MENYRQAYSRTISALDDALLQLTISAPRPSVFKKTRALTYRYEEKSLQQALIIKCVRILSALRALHTLLQSGLMLDAGAIMRIIDEVSSDIMFLAGPILHQHEPEPNHQRYLKELFQEEFEGHNVLETRAKRDRVPRSKIRAYIARKYGQPDDVQSQVAVHEFIDNVFSGFIHGAAVHTMDLYDGIQFNVSLDQEDGPLVDMSDQFGHYVQRVLSSFSISAVALGRRDVFDVLYNLNFLYFDSYGELGSKNVSGI